MADGYTTVYFALVVIILVFGLIILVGVFCYII